MQAIGEVLLDTSVVVPFLKGDLKVRDKFSKTAALFLPQVVLGELYCGVYLSQNPPKHLDILRNFLKAVVVLSSGPETAQSYGRLRAELALAGTPIPENDIWIAALAIQHRLPLASRDAHFRKVKGLKILEW